MKKYKKVLTKTENSLSIDFYTFYFLILIISFLYVIMFYMNHVQASVEDLLNKYLKIIKSFYLFDSQIYLINEASYESLDMLMNEFINGCEVFFKRILKENEDFKNYDLRMIDEEIGRKVFLELGRIETGEPFNASYYDEVMNQITPYFKKLNWISVYYGIGELNNINNPRRIQKYGDLTIVVDTKDNPVKVSFKDKKVNLTPKEIGLLYKVARKYYTDKTGVSTKELEMYLNTTYDAINKIQSNLNKKLEKHTNIKHTIVADSSAQGHRVLNI